MHGIIHNEIFLNTYTSNFFSIKFIHILVDLNSLPKKFFYVFSDTCKQNHKLLRNGQSFKSVVTFIQSII